MSQSLLAEDVPACLESNELIFAVSWSPSDRAKKAILPSGFVAVLNSLLRIPIRILLDFNVVQILELADVLMILVEGLGQELLHDLLLDEDVPEVACDHRSTQRLARRRAIMPPRPHLLRVIPEGFLLLLMSLAQELSLLSGGPTITPTAQQPTLEEYSAPVQHAVVLQRSGLVLDLHTAKDNSEVGVFPSPLSAVSACIV
mmetsp:Transcript_419/g.929  ORF Transcript_419/g.929 Transcript_419/m.929 type:complete len:201 (-) Transcript_419:138-740(-)